MDLMSARVECAALSNKSGKPAYVILVKDEFEVTQSPSPTDDLYAKYVGGGEDKNFLNELKEVNMETIEEETTMEVKFVPKKAANKKKAKVRPAKKAAKKSVKPDTKKVVVKKTTTKKEVKKAGVRAIYGSGLSILELLRKGNAHTLESLVKKFKTTEGSIAFHLSIIRSNGYKIERTNKGYKLVK